MLRTFFYQSRSFRIWSSLLTSESNISAVEKTKCDHGVFNFITPEKKNENVLTAPDISAVDSSLDKSKLSACERVTFMQRLESSELILLEEVGEFSNEKALNAKKTKKKKPIRARKSGKNLAFSKQDPDLPASGKSLDKPWLHVREPLTFVKKLDSSELLRQVEAENASKVGEFLDRTASVTGKGNDVDWNMAMMAIEESENTYPTEVKDRQSLMKKAIIRPTFNVSTVINDVPSLQRLVDLGTQLHFWESSDKLDVAFRIDFETDVVPRIKLLVDCGVNPEDLGDIFSHNPDIFDQTVDDLQVRINYLKWKNFTKAQIVNVIVETNSRWLNLSVLDVDGRLGFMQKNFALSGPQVRSVVDKYPQLITWKGYPAQVSFNMLALKDSMGFTIDEVRKLLLGHPKIFLARDTDDIQDAFDVLHNESGFSHELLVWFPEALTAGSSVSLRQRLKFLKKLSRDQFDPTKPNYVNPDALALYDDVEFCLKAAKAPVSLFNQFLKTT